MTADVNGTRQGGQPVTLAAFPLPLEGPALEWPQRQRERHIRARWPWRLITAAVPVAVVAVVAGVVSYSHIVALGLRTHQGQADSHLLPIPIDGLIVAGSVILAAGSPLGWLGVALGVGGTLFANLQFGLPHGPLSAAVSTWPAVAFTVATFMLERWLKSQARGDRPGRAANAGDSPLATSATAAPDSPATGPEQSPQAASGQVPEQASGQIPEQPSGQPEPPVPVTRRSQSRRKAPDRSRNISDADLKELIRAAFEADPEVSASAVAKNLGRSRGRVGPLLEEVRHEAGERSPRG